MVVGTRPRDLPRVIGRDGRILAPDHEPKAPGALDHENRLGALAGSLLERRLINGYRVDRGKNTTRCPAGFPLGRGLAWTTLIVDQRFPDAGPDDH